MKKKKHNRCNVGNEIQDQSIEEYNGDVLEEEFKLIIPEPKRRKHKRKSSGTRTRYYDLRLVWLFLLLAGAILLVRAVVCQHFNIPFLNEIDPNSPDGKEFIGHDALSKSYKQMEGMIMLVEAIVSLIVMGFFVQGPKNKNSRNDGSEMDSIPIWLWGLGFMALPAVVVYCQSYWWLVYGVAMFFFAFIIGKYEGFALPLFRDLGKNFYYGTKDMTVKFHIRRGAWPWPFPFGNRVSVFMPGHSSILVLIICICIFVALLIYYLLEAW